MNCLGFIRSRSQCKNSRGIKWIRTNIVSANQVVVINGVSVLKAANRVMKTVVA